MATTEEIEKYCRHCVSRDFMHGRGLICKRSGGIPAFSEQCGNFEKDEILAKMAPPKPNDFPQFKSREELLSEENLRKGIMMASVVALVGIVTWVMLSLWVGYQIVQMSIVIGVVVGLAMRVGKGVRPIFGIIAALLALFSCVLGSFFSIIGHAAHQQSITYIEVMLNVDYIKVFSLMTQDTTMILMCYAFAVYEAFKFSFRKQNQPQGGRI